MSRFSYLECLRGKRFKCRNAEVSFLMFDNTGSPVYRHTVLCGFVRYFQWVPSFDSWAETERILCFGGDEPPIPAPEPFPVVVKTCWSDDLERCFQRLELCTRFVKHGTEKNHRQFLRLILMCQVRSRTLPSLPLEMIFFLMTFMRIVELPVQN